MPDPSLEELATRFATSQEFSELRRVEQEMMRRERTVAILKTVVIVLWLVAFVVLGTVIW